MTLFYYYGSGDLGNAAVRLGRGFSLTEYAESGSIATSNVDVDDLSGSLDLKGLKTFRVDETACSFLRLFTGYMADRNIGHEDSLTLGASRRWSASVMDGNLALNLRALRGSAANRPAETDIARITWWLSTVYTSGIANSLTFVDTSGPVNLEASDYRGRTGFDLISDAAQVSGKNYFAAWDDTANSLKLHYYAPTSTFNSCTLKISGSAADIDSSTVFGVAKPGAVLNRDPSEVYSGVYLNYGTGAAAVYVEDSGTASAFVARDLVVTDGSVKGSTQATAKANQYLAMGNHEFDRITCHLPNVPRSQVNLIRQGMRIQIKFAYLPTYEAYTYIRITKRTVRQSGETDQLYDLDLELCLPKIGPGSLNAGAPPGDDVAPTDGSALTLNLYQSFEETGSGYFGPFAGGYERIDPDAFGLGSISAAVDGIVDRTPEGNISYPYTDCGVGTGGVAGLATREVWHRFQVDLSDNTLVGVRFTVLPFLVAGSGYETSPGGFLVGEQTVACGISTGTDSAGADQDGSFTEVGRVGDQGGQVFVPRSLLIDDGVGYCWFVLAPGWEISSDLFFCNSAANHPFGYGLTGHTSNNSQIVSGVKVNLQGGGDTPWVGIGVGDGTTTTFTLIGWDGSGTPEVRIDGLSLAAGDYSYSAGAGTVTITPAPADGAMVAARFHYGAGSRP